MASSRSALGFIGALFKVERSDRASKRAREDPSKTFLRELAVSLPRRVAYRPERFFGPFRCWAEWLGSSRSANTAQPADSVPTWQSRDPGNPLTRRRPHLQPGREAERASPTSSAMRTILGRIATAVPTKRLGAIRVSRCLVNTRASAKKTWYGPGMKQEASPAHLAKARYCLSSAVRYFEKPDCLAQLRRTRQPRRAAQGGGGNTASTLTAAVQPSIANDLIFGSAPNPVALDDLTGRELMLTAHKPLTEGVDP